MKTQSEKMNFATIAELVPIRRTVPYLYDRDFVAVVDRVLIHPSYAFSSAITGGRTLTSYSKWVTSERLAVLIKWHRDTN